MVCTPGVGISQDEVLQMLLSVGISAAVVGTLVWAVLKNERKKFNRRRKGNRYV